MLEHIALLQKSLFLSSILYFNLLKIGIIQKNLPRFSPCANEACSASLHCDCNLAVSPPVTLCAVAGMWPR